ncbi:hypothetical protein ACEWY4_016871 [Coilia grayii]|uniref:DUF4806 domain-containing protein n=1 Tax=Coilia grayii TaxID=363190 RepID=A0ABD1JLL6_9TELE
MVSAALPTLNHNRADSVTTQSCQLQLCMSRSIKDKECFSRPGPQPTVPALSRNRADCACYLGRVLNLLEAPAQGNRQGEGEVEDMLEQPLETTEQLEQLCHKLEENVAYKKKIIRYLSLQAGVSLGDGVRRMIRKIGTNELWGNYSFKGRKGKRPFQALSLNEVLIRACQKAYPQTRGKCVEDCVAVTLKHAPHRGPPRVQMLARPHVEDDEEEETEAEEL